MEGLCSARMIYLLFGGVLIKQLKENWQEDTRSMSGNNLRINFKRLFWETVWTIGIKNSLNNKKKKGMYGEWLAKKFLLKNGYLMIAQNWRSRRNQRLEIDLIFKDSGVIVFVEVRSRSSSSMVTGFESVNFKKKNILKRSFSAFLRERNYVDDFYRFDIVEVDLPSSRKENYQLFHHENIAIF